MKNKIDTQADSENGSPIGITGLPFRRNMHWHDLRHLLERIGGVLQKRNGSLKISRNGHTMSLVPGEGEVGIETIAELRRFFEHAPADGVIQPEETPWLAVIDHDEARIFHSDTPESPFLRISRHRNHPHAHSQKEFAAHAADTNDFFEAVALALAEAPKVVLSGNGKGSASEMGKFIAWLGGHHRDVANHLLGAASCDRKHLTDRQQLAAVRAYCDGIQ